MARNKILVVDDEPNQRQIYKLILEDDGHEVTTAQSGEQALRFASETDFDLVLTDYKMTGMDGLTLLGELLKQDPSLIVIMMTAHGSVESVKEALRGGAFDYLEKPIDRDQLLKARPRRVQILADRSLAQKFGREHLAVGDHLRFTFAYR